MSLIADTPLSDSTNPSTSSPTHTGSKRLRAQLSCNACRHGKLKCDRELPCDQCLKRDKGPTCEYTQAPPQKRPARAVRKRLHHLEGLVKDMMNNESSDANSSTPGPSVEKGKATIRPEASQNLDQGRDPSRSHDQTTESIGVPETANAFGRVVLNANEATYVGATHWAAILNELEEVKTYFDEDSPDAALEDQLPLDTQQEAPSMLLNISKVTTKLDLLRSLPPRPVVDRLVSRYFSSNHPATNVIHKPTFRKEYLEFWENPTETSVTWIALLYSIIALATFFAFRAADEAVENRAPPLELIAEYRSLCSRALVLSNYTKPGIYTLEALILYFEADFLMKADVQSKSWLLNGMTIRLALRMGCHRDANHHPNISVFQGEMRRRLWHLIMQFEMLVSFNLGLPSIIQGLQHDTKPPHNLFDDEFGPDSTSLPPERPEAQLTPNTYTICKSRIAIVFGKIAEQANALNPPSYQEVMELDERIREASRLVPSALQPHSMEESIMDSPDTVMQRFNLILLFHKCICVLHRRYLLADRSIATYNYSRSSCLTSALEILHFQYVIHQCTLSGAPLSRHRWFINTLTIHDFLLASMIIYIFLTTDLELPMSHTSTQSSASLQTSQQQDMVKILETSYNIWVQSIAATGDALKAKAVLLDILVNLRNKGFPVQTNLTGESTSFPPHNNALLSGGLDASLPYGPISPSAYYDIGPMMDPTVNIDWELWDSHVNAAQEIIGPMSQTTYLPAWQDQSLNMNLDFPPDMALALLNSIRDSEAAGQLRS